MKKLFLGVALLALLASAAHAYTSVSPPPTSGPSSGVAGSRLSDTGEPNIIGSSQEANGDLDRNRHRDPTRPVPEPGTMVLASMGLLALGAAARKRRERG